MAQSGQTNQQEKPSSKSVNKKGRGLLILQTLYFESNCILKFQLVDEDGTTFCMSLRRSHIQNASSGTTGLTNVNMFAIQCYVRIAPRRTLTE